MRFCFALAQRMLPWQPILEAKWAYSPSFITPAFRNRLEYCNSDFRRFSGNYFSTLYVNLVRLGTPEFTRMLLVDQEWGYFRYVRWAAILLGTAPVSKPSQFCGAMSAQFCFTTTAMGRHCCAVQATVMDNAVGCYAYGDIFSCMAFGLYLGSSEDIPTERMEELVLFSRFRDAPIPRPRDGHVISGHWRRTRSRAPTPVDSERPSERLD